MMLTQQQAQFMPGANAPMGQPILSRMQTQCSLNVCDQRPTAPSRHVKEVEPAFSAAKAVALLDKAWHPK
eukprot:2449787-Amphidinium_carterae.1